MMLARQARQVRGYCLSCHDGNRDRVKPLDMPNQRCAFALDFLNEDEGGRREVDESEL